MRGGVAERPWMRGGWGVAHFMLAAKNWEWAMGLVQDNLEVG